MKGNDAIADCTAMKTTQAECLDQLHAGTHPLPKRQATLHQSSILKLYTAVFCPQQNTVHFTGKGCRIKHTVHFTDMGCRIKQSISLTRVAELNTHSVSLARVAELNITDKHVQDTHQHTQKKASNSGFGFN